MWWSTRAYMCTVFHHLHLPRYKLFSVCITLSVESASCTSLRQPHPVHSLLSSPGSPLPAVTHYLVTIGLRSHHPLPLLRSFTARLQLISSTNLFIRRLLHPLDCFSRNRLVPDLGRRWSCCNFSFLPFILWRVVCCRLSWRLVSFFTNKKLGKPYKATDARHFLTTPFWGGGVPRWSTMPVMGRRTV